MTYVIAEPCVDLMDRSCVDACPVDSIVLAGMATAEEAAHIADNAAFFYELLPGRDAAIGDPGGAGTLGPVGADTALVAALPSRES